MMLSKTQLVLPYCWVCEVRFKTSVPPGPANCERHHIMPRNAGGTDGPEVSLCERHHSTLHKIAERIHKKKPFTDLLVGESSEWHKKLVWLAGCVVRSEQAVEGDPNKQFKNTVSLNADEIEMLRRLQQAFPDKGRSELIRMALFLFYRSVFKQ